MSCYTQMKTLLKLFYPDHKTFYSLKKSAKLLRVEQPYLNYYP